MDLRNDIYLAVRPMDLRIGFGRLTDGTYSTQAPPEPQAMEVKRRGLPVP